MLSAIEITYPGTGNESQFSYDAFGRCVKIVEVGTSPSYSGNATKQFVLCGLRRCEERDAMNAVVKQFYAIGQKNGSASYFYAPDHLGSVREMTDAAGTVQAEYSFSPFGERAAITETVACDFGFTGHYRHSRSALNLSPLRAYDASLGRFINRDPFGENVGLNLFAYVSNSPIRWFDPLGGFGSTGSNSGGGSRGSNSGGGSAGSNSGGGSFGSNSGDVPPGWAPPPQCPSWNGPPNPPGWDPPPLPPTWVPPSATGGSPPAPPTARVPYIRRYFGPEGTTLNTYGDGSRAFEIPADVASQIVYALLYQDGTRMFIFANGNVFYGYPNGNNETVMPDGTRWIIHNRAPFTPGIGPGFDPGTPGARM